MNAGWKNALKAIVPRSWRLLARRYGSEPVYVGRYASWSEAVAASGGYADSEIFEKTLAATRAVRDGQAVWERDTVLFMAPAANAPLLAALQHAAATNRQRLNVADFGGALGSTWWQHRAWLTGLAEVRWSIVEQVHVVEAGQREFTTGPLQFYASLAECCAKERPEVLLLSSVLPYLETPHAFLAEARSAGFRHIIIDRTGFVSRGPDWLTVQHVPREIYAASYPCWFFDRTALLRPFAAEWRIAAEWPTGDEVDIDAAHGGLMLEKKSL